MGKEVAIKKAYRISIRHDAKGDLLRVKFGAAATNDIIVQQAAAECEAIVKAGGLRGGSVLRIKGPSSVPVAFSLGLALAPIVINLYQAVAVYDDRTDMQKFVIVWIGEGSRYKLGDSFA